MSIKPGGFRPGNTACGDFCGESVLETSTLVSSMFQFALGVVKPLLRTLALRESSQSTRALDTGWIKKRVVDRSAH